MIVTVSKEFGQDPNPVDQTNVLAPKFNPVTPELFTLVNVTAEPPAITVQIPVPTKGTFPFKVAVLAQTVKSVPALAGVGNGLTLINTVLVEAGQTPLDIVHTMLFVPVIKPVTVELLRVGVVTVEVPEITVHTPVPTAGIFAFNVVEETHRF